MELGLTVSGIGLVAGITAFRMAWAEQHRKLASIGIILCAFGVLQRILPLAIRGLRL